MSIQFTESNEDMTIPNSNNDVIRDAKMKHKKVIAAIDIWRLRRKLKKKVSPIPQNTSNILQETDNEDSQSSSYSFDHSSLETPSIDTANIDPSVFDSPVILTSEHLSFDSHYPTDISQQSFTVDGTKNTENYLSLPYDTNCESSPVPPHVLLNKRLGSLIESRRLSFELDSPKDSISTSKFQFDRRCSFDVHTNKSRVRNNSEPCLRAASCKSSIDKLPSPTKSLTVEEFYKYFTNQVSECTEENNKLKKSPMPPRERVRSDSITSIQSLEEGLSEIFNSEIRTSRESLQNYINSVGSPLDRSEEISIKEGKARNKEVIKDLEEKYITVTGEICLEDCEDPKTIKGFTDVFSSDPE